MATAALACALLAGAQARAQPAPLTLAIDRLVFPGDPVTPLHAGDEAAFHIIGHTTAYEPNLALQLRVDGQVVLTLPPVAVFYLPDYSIDDSARYVLLAPGPHLVEVAFAGSANVAAATSAPLSIDVLRAPTSATGVVASVPHVFRTDLGVTACVGEHRTGPLGERPFGPPTGTVTVHVGGQSTSVALSPGGAPGNVSCAQAVLPGDTLPRDPRVEVEYAGDAYWAPLPRTLILGVNDVPNLVLDVSRSVARPIVDQPVTINFAASALPGVAGVPDGELEIHGMSGVFRVPLDGNGRASVIDRYGPATGTSAGGLWFFYRPGPSWYAGIHGGIEPSLPRQYFFPVDPAPTRVQIVPFTGTPWVGGPATFTAALIAIAPAAFAPRFGIVSFHLGPDATSFVACRANVVNAVATCTGSFLQPGRQTVFADFDGSTSYLPSTDAASVDVSPAPPPGPHLGVTPSSVDFGSVAASAQSGYVGVTVRNAGDAILSLAITASPGFDVVSHCGSALAAQASCLVDVAMRAGASPGAQTGTLSISGNAPESPAAVSLSGTVAGPDDTDAFAIIEYYHAGLDHYFITGDAGEIAALDAGRLAGWSRTGARFTARRHAGGGMTSSVCRFYGRPDRGLDTHFFSASIEECAAVARRFSADWIEETAEAFAVALPDAAGKCAAGYVPLWRLFNGRSDANHRYTLDPAVRDAMVAKGYTLEGSGPGFAVMCTLP